MGSPRGPQNPMGDPMGTKEPNGRSNGDHRTQWGHCGDHRIQWGIQWGPINPMGHPKGIGSRSGAAVGQLWGAMGRGSHSRGGRSTLPWNPMGTAEPNGDQLTQWGTQRGLDPTVGQLRGSSGAAVGHRGVPWVGAHIVEEVGPPFHGTQWGPQNPMGTN